MLNSQHWLDLGSPKQKFYDMRFVGTDAIIKSWKFHTDPLKALATVQVQYFWTEGHLNCYGDLTWPDPIIFFFL